MPWPVHSVVLSFTAAALLILSGCGGGSPQSSNADPDPAPTTNPVVSLAAPATVAATTDAGQVTLQWNPVEGATSYAIYMAVPTSGATLVSKVKYAEAASSPHLVNGLSRGQTYLFTIVAVAATGDEGDASAEVTVRLPMATTALATGAKHSCALLADGAVKCWGRNNASQLGSAISDYSASPVVVPGVSNAKSISAAGQHSCAVLADGNMQCWGTYGEGSTAVTFTSPIVIGDIASAVSVASSRDTDCALLSDARVACFNPVATSSTPTFAPSLSKVVALAPAGTVVNGVANVKQIAAGEGFTCALLNDGTVTCWNGVAGNLGYAPARPVPNIVAATAIAAKGDQACALLPAGVQCWKSVATISVFDTPLNFILTEIQTALSGIKAIAVGAGTAPSAYFAITEGGTVQAWNVLPAVGVDASCGDCFLGSGSVTGSTSNIQTIIAPTPMPTAPDTLRFNSNDFVIIKAAPPVPYNSEGWPSQSPPQVIWVGQTVSSEPFSVSRLQNVPFSPGVAALVSISLPVLVTDLVNVTTIANGNTHGCALLLSGDVTCWGDNQYGQLGNGEISTVLAAPVSVDDL